MTAGVAEKGTRRIERRGRSERGGTQVAIDALILTGGASEDFAFGVLGMLASSIIVEAHPAVVTVIGTVHSFHVAGACAVHEEKRRG